MKNYLFFILSIFIFVSCGHKNTDQSLESILYEIADKAKGTVGIAYVSNKDTITVNNNVHYPLMSVFKLHQAVAVAHILEMSGSSFDTTLHINTDSLDKETWSPMLKELPAGENDIPIRKLIDYSVTLSDNNASNLLFNHIVSPKECDRFLRSITEDTTFSIAYSEAQMKKSNSLSYKNYSSPLSCALLISRIFTDTIVSPYHTESIRNALLATKTGNDRIKAPFENTSHIKVAHKTGSGYRNSNNELIAYNDVAFITMPDGNNYSLAVMIRDFNGTENEAAKIIAEISHKVFEYIKSND